MVIRWAFGHHGSVDSFVEVPDADLGLVWAGLEGLLGSRSGTRPPASSFRRRRSAPPVSRPARNGWSRTSTGLPAAMANAGGSSWRSAHSTEGSCPTPADAGQTPDSHSSSADAVQGEDLSLDVPSGGARGSVASGGARWPR